jgi:hypothetical protein
VKSIRVIIFKIIEFSIFFLLVFFSFVLFGLSVFGSSLEEYQSFDKACLTLIGIIFGELHYEKYHEYSNLKYDKCIQCGLESPYTEDTHIDMRYGYIEGVGQFCFQENICKK